jgi:hypothetical protein
MREILRLTVCYWRWGKCQNYQMVRIERRPRSLPRRHRKSAFHLTAVSEQIALRRAGECRSLRWMRNPFRYFNGSPEVIRLTVMMYIRYPLSLRQVEDLPF